MQIENLRDYSKNNGIKLADQQFILTEAWTEIEATLFDSPESLRAKFDDVMIEAENACCLIKVSFAEGPAMKSGVS